MKNDAIFQARIPSETLDQICEIGNGSRKQGLMTLLTAYTINTDDQVKDLLAHISELESALEDRRAIIKKQMKMIDELEARLK